MGKSVENKVQKTSNFGYMYQANHDAATGRSKTTSGIIATHNIA